MILINLLPEEYRQKRRTPVKMLIAVATTATVNTTLLAYWAWTAFGVAAEVSSELSVLEDTMGGLNPQIAYHDELEKESKLFHSREKTLSDVTGKRISWTEKLDQLIDVVHKGGDGEKYLVWFDGASVDTDVNERSKTFGSLEANGNSGSPKFAYVANFLDDVQASDFQRDFNPPADPEGSQTLVDTELDPPEVWSFPFELTLKSPEDRREAAAEERARLLEEESADSGKGGDDAAKKSQPKASGAAKEGK
ncbi:MAG: hypothetical protein AAF682_13670 [Planctomycetota bacterium]